MYNALVPSFHISKIKGWPCNFIPSFLNKRNTNICSHKNLHINAHYSFIHNGLKLETTMLLLPLSHFSCVRLCVTPQTAAHQAPPSLGFSRQEQWSGVPLPSLMHESEKSKWSRSVMSDSLRPHGLQPIRLLRPWDFPGDSTGVGCHCLLQNISANIH